MVEKCRTALNGVLYLFAVLPVAVPGMVLGLAYIFTFNASGSMLNGIYGTLAILVVSNLIHYFTVPFLTATTALKQMDAEFESVSASLGVAFYRTFWRVTVPIALPSIVGISMYFFLNAMVTLSAVVFLVAPGTELAAVAVLLLDDAGETAQATAHVGADHRHRLAGAAHVLGAAPRRDPAHPGLDDRDPRAGPPGMTEHARVVVIGGGVIGASVAYHLTRLGWRDVRLLERRTLTCGTTWHAAGLVGRLRGSRTASRLVKYSAELYARLPAETGFETGWRRCGSLIVARTPERLTQLRRSVALSRARRHRGAHDRGGRGDAALAALPHRRSGRRHADPRRRTRHSRRRHPGARGRRPRRWRRHPGGCRGARGCRARRRGDGRGDRRGPDRVRGGRQLRRHVGARARPQDNGVAVPAVAGRALLRGDPPDAPA